MRDNTKYLLYISNIDFGWPLSTFTNFFKISNAQKNLDFRGKRFFLHIF